MAKAHIWQYIIDNEGAAVPGASINIYVKNVLSDEYEFANYYTSETSSSSLSGESIISDNNGFFEFWLGDYRETAGYTTSRKFRITWEKEGITSGFINDVNISLDANQAGLHSEIVEADQFITGVDFESVDITHNLNKPYPIIICYDMENQTVVATTAIYVSDNITKVNVSKSIYNSGGKRSYITIVG